MNISNQETTPKGLQRTGARSHGHVRTGNDKPTFQAQAVSKDSISPVQVYNKRVGSIVKN